MISRVLPAYSYLLDKRGINENTINTFCLGYVDQVGEVYIPANFQGQLPALDKRFYHSTLFPVFSVYGDCIAASCRPLGTSSVKYLNTSYDKAQNLYGLNVSWRDCLKEQKIYVVEGNIDVLQVYQSGINNVVGMLGSAFSFTQLCSSFEVR